uniref:Uncharacterized protein n=1 Tax=Caenorhabditis tropicalis TaxID=1561998 RepID=A0A1I7TT29_9PELO
MRRHLLILAICTTALTTAQHKKARQATSTTDNLGDDYSDFSAQNVKNSGANHELKQVTYSTIAPKFDIPTRAPLLNPNPIGQKNPVQTPKKPVVVDYKRGYYFQHYPWDRLPRRYLLRPGMTYVYPPQYQYATYRYPYLPYTDHYSIYRTHPGIGSGCGGGGCGGGGYAQAYQGYGGYSSGCGGGSGGGCGGYDDDDDEDSYEDSEEGDGKSGEAKINKKDPLEDLELEDLEKLSKSSDDTKASSSSSDDAELESEPIEIKKSGSKDDEDLIDDRKKAKRNFLIKWA